jgi:hypothetical protein
VRDRSDGNGLRFARRSPLAAIEDHAARLAVVGDEIERHMTAVDAGSITAGAFAAAKIRDEQFDFARVGFPRPSERRPALAHEREGSIVGEARGKSAEHQLAGRKSATQTVVRSRRSLGQPEELWTVFGSSRHPTCTMKMNASCPLVAKYGTAVAAVSDGNQASQVDNGGSMRTTCSVQPILHSCAIEQHISSKSPYTVIRSMPALRSSTRIVSEHDGSIRIVPSRPRCHFRSSSGIALLPADFPW